MTRRPWAGFLVSIALAIGCTGTTTVGMQTSTGGTSTSGGTTTGGTGGLAPGASCATDAECASSVCGVNGDGRCCIASCMASADSACNPTGCDATGACAYPLGTACGVVSCTGHTLETGLCTSTGTCVATPSDCPNHLLCASAGAACLTKCVSSADCVSGFTCNGGSCQAPVATGPCTGNDNCTSGVCGLTGTGNCCTAACDHGDPLCGPRQCDATGACVYADTSVVCGATPSCDGGLRTNQGSCDGAGSCHVSTTDCTPYACDIGRVVCASSCQDNTACSAAGFCDAPNQTCCSTLNAPETLKVDSVFGSDVTCCGIGTNQPCRTLTRAMALIDLAKAQGVKVIATVDGGGGDWSPATEKYPIALGWGVELQAPGVYFLDLGGEDAGAIFNATVYPNDPIGSASVFGTAADPVGVGQNQANTVLTTDPSAIEVEAYATLYIANAKLNELQYADGTSSQAILVDSLGSLWLGKNQAADVTGTVFIGNGDGDPSTAGYAGINCAGDCTVADGQLDGQSSVVIQGQNAGDIIVQEQGAITLTSAPVLGSADCTTHFNDALGIAILGNGTVTFSNGTIQCQSQTGLVAYSVEQPVVTIDHALIQNCLQGVASTAGTTSITNSILTHNQTGVYQFYDGIIDLSGGGNVVICNFATGPGMPGMGVYNMGSATLAADNVTWDTPGPDYFSCDEAFSNCVCNISSCSVTPGANGMDAVADSMNVGTITTTGAIYLDAGCQ